MRKLNLVLLISVIMLISVVALFIRATYAEDTKPVDMKTDKVQIKVYDPCSDLNCRDTQAIKKGNKDAGQMGMGQGMMCPMMQKKMESGMPMGNMQMMGSIIDQIMGNADKLQFTQDQRDKLDNLVSVHRKDMIKKKADLDVASIDLEGLMKKETPDLKAVADQFKKVSGLEADLKYSEFEFSVNVKALLTNEQKDTLKMMMKHNEQMGMKMDMPMDKK
jgi:Spy/CpxP family protein refolding chaperone